jgi:transcriptional antiterminator NusG
MTESTTPPAADATPNAPTPAAEPIPPVEAAAPPPESPAVVPEPPPQPDAPAAESETPSADEAPSAAVETPPAETPAAEPPAVEATSPEAPPEPPPPAPVGEGETAPEPPEPAPAPPTNKRWYVVKVQSGREESIKEAIERRVKIERLEEFFGQIVIPTETHVEVRKGKRVTKKTKLYPGYLMAEVEYNDRILYLFRETSGVGDFVGGTITRPPPPMTEREVQRMMGPKEPAEKEKIVAPKARFQNGDRVKVLDGAFKDMEGEVKEVLEDKGQVKIEVTIFGRPVTMDLEAWHVEPA